MFFRFRTCLWLIVPLLLLSCRREKPSIPYIYVDFYVNITDPNFSALNAVSGYVYVTGGSKGIILYRKGANEFMAYDRHCPYDPDASCSRCVVETSGLLVKDDCCGSVYLITDGSPSSGPGTSSDPLLQYHTTFDGMNIHVTN
ncbi:MAG: hypothetical protein IT233_06210 [Bacteroidia bacterium]|nr:hypothetical protein [Bacteroidia bacterium]